MATALSSVNGQMCHTAEDWQAQLEEVLALQSIFADNFRVTHIPGQKLTGSSGSNTTAPTATSLNSCSGSNNASTSPSSYQDVEQLIESLIGSSHPSGCSEPEQQGLLGSLLTCEAIVEVELPSGQLQIILDTQESSLPQQHSQCDNEHLNNCKCNLHKIHSSGSSKVPFGPPVQHLPPVRVQVKYPHNYPSSKLSPPLLTLTAGWLSKQHEQQLQQQLQNLWEQQGPGPICFTWLEYLKTDSLTDLQIVNELVLQPQQLPAQQQGHPECSTACSTEAGGITVPNNEEAGCKVGNFQQQQPQEKAKVSHQQQPAMQDRQQQQELPRHQVSPDTSRQNVSRNVGLRSSSAPSSHGSNSNSKVEVAVQQAANQPQQLVLSPRSTLRATATPFSPGQALVAPDVQQPRLQVPHPQHSQQQKQQDKSVQQRQRRSKCRQQGTAYGSWQQASGKQSQAQPSSTTMWREVPHQQQNLQQGHDHHHRGWSSRDLAGSHHTISSQRSVKQHTAQQLHEVQQQQQQERPQQQQQKEKEQQDVQQEQAHHSGSTPDTYANGHQAPVEETQQQQQQQVQQVNAAEQLAVQMLRYSAAREVEAFRESIHTCSICFEQVPGSDCLQLPECRHFYCINCMKHHAAAQLEQGAVENMRCPEPSCRRPFQPYVIKELLGETGYARWEELLLQRTLDKMDDVVYCPRCDTVCIEDPDHCAQCSKCLYVFCSFCSDSWHPGTECLDPHERLRILERRKKATGAGDKRYEMDLVNQLMNLKYLGVVSRKCPSCGMATIKSEGCNKMTCVYCNSNWCWKCRQVIQGYDHFGESRCTMFNQEEVDRWNAMMWANERAREVEMGQIHMQVRLQQNPAAFQVCRCPVCGQENLREGRNNLLRCWACNCHFCHSCRSWLRGKVGQHFVGPKACKQHGD